MDRILASQRMAASDLLPAIYNAKAMPGEQAESETVPVVSHYAALFEPFIRPSGFGPSFISRMESCKLPERAFQARARPGSGLSRFAFRLRTPCRWSR